MEQNSFWEVAFDNLSQGIYILDHAGNYIYCNRAFLDMVEADREDILQLNTFQLVPEGQVSKSVGASALEQKQQLTIINTVVTPKGLRYRQLATATPIFDNMGDVVYVLVETTRLEEMTRRYQTALLVEDSSCVDLYTGASVTPAPAEVVAESPAMRTLLALAGHLAQVDATVLLTGETGAGKEVLAQYLHSHSPRSNRELVEINCAALPENLLEAELFGYERGAFTGANREGKKGVFESADKGTVFLDEVGDLPLDMQVHLLRILQEMQVTRVGGVKPIKVDVRVIAATNRDLLEMVRAKTFREDLYYRLNVVPIQIPPLRERTGDIQPLVQLFLQQMNKKYREKKHFSPAAMDAMYSYSWPGNVRELKNVVEQAVILSAQAEIQPGELPIASHHWPEGERVEFSGEHIDLKAELTRLEYEYICQAYAKYGTVRAAAASLGMDNSTFVRKRQKYQACFKNEARCENTANGPKP